ncbi:DUF2177 family protein [Methylocystis echinoides]|uniref:Membrane protein n=1 Tax=Methylocystis echinoides TaxID=29468 RepID=A0A9W6GVK4_9HYPH|nr:DUF2177 family protein [Methylocystis echinoides]GLI93839.1 membrane protein [Methylocystis echinoides]
MKQVLFAYAGTAASMLALDAVWLSTMAERLYRPELGDLLAEDFRAEPALAFYVVYIFGVTRFAALPALRDGGWRKALLDGALLGLVAYGTYDLTNEATLRRWPFVVTAFDLLWGAFLTGVSAVAGYLAARRVTSSA